MSADMDIESYIKDLSPELQEKARACGSVKELIALAKDAKVPVPDEALAAIAGGDGTESGGCKPKIQCPKCGSYNCTITLEFEYTCLNCGYVWHQS